MTQFQRAGRGAGGHRGARPPRPAGRGHRPLPARRDRRPGHPGALPRGGGVDRGGSRRRAGRRRRICTPGWPCSTPSAAARMEPTNRRRVVRALEVTLGAGPAVLRVRARARGVPDQRGAPGRPGLRPRRDRPADRGALRHDGRGRAGRRGPGPGGTPRGPRAHGSPGPRLPRDPGPRRRGAPLEDVPRRGGPAHTAIRPPPGLVVPARPPDRLGRRRLRRPRRCSSRPSRCTAEHPQLREWKGARLQARGRRQRLPRRARPRRHHRALRGPGPPAGRPPARHRGGRDHPGRAGARRARLCRWICATPTAAPPR